VDLQRVSTDAVAVHDREGNVLEDRAVLMYLRGTTTLATIYDAPSAGSVVPQPCLLTDERGLVRLNTGNEAWVVPNSYDVDVVGADLLRWEAVSGRGSIPVGPADGTNIAGEYPDEVVGSGGGGGGDVTAHNALAEGVHGFPATMADGQGLIWDESENNWDAATLVTPAEIASQLGTVIKRSTGADTTLGLPDVGARVDISSTADRVVTVPLNTFSEGASIEVCRALSIATGTPGLVTVTIAGPGVFENQVDGTESTSIGITNRFGSVFLVLRVASSNKWLVSGQIA